MYGTLHFDFASSILSQHFSYLWKLCFFLFVKNISVSVPVGIDRVNVTAQNDQLVLSWQKVKNSNTSYMLRDDNKTEISILGLHNLSVLTYTVSSLSPGTKYNFTLYTIFEGVRSRGLNFTAVTGFIIDFYPS